MPTSTLQYVCNIVYRVFKKAVRTGVLPKGSRASLHGSFNLKDSSGKIRTMRVVPQVRLS